MALFSDNPFVGAFRSQQRRAQEAAMARQQAMAEQKQQRQKVGMEQLKAEEEFRAENPGVRELQAMSKAKSLYGYGLGGSSPWTTKAMTDPQTGAIKRVQVLDPNKYITADRPYAGPADKRKPAPRVLGVGTSNRQEFRGLAEAKAPTSIGGVGNIVYGEAVKGVNVIEAPELFRRGKGTSERDSRGQFYSEVTGKPMGSLMGRGAYGGFGKDAVDEQGNPLSKYSPNVMKRRAARGQNPYNAEAGGYVEKQEPSSFFPKNSPIFPFPAISTPIGGMMRSFA
jgi:hypothetical protein